MRWYFVFFLASGFAGLVYEIVWLRLAMASFGITMPLVSTVLSVFMAGLALGSWTGGRLAARSDAGARRRLILYAAIEAAIAACALIVPELLASGRGYLATAGREVAWDSAAFYVASGLWITASVLPACVAMGMTFPIAMAAIRAEHPDASPRAFSFLYLANVLGATSGTLAAAFVLVEVLGFRRTLLVAVGVNLMVAAGAVVRSRYVIARAAVLGPSPRAALVATDQPGRAGLLPLFVTGFASMAMEVVWVRQFTPYLGNVVYAFAAILATYLAGTFVGSQLYRGSIRPETSARNTPLLWIVAGVCALVPLAAADPRVPLADPLRLLLGLLPVTAAVGLITPMLVDRWSGGDPARAGAAYAVNVLGSITGPLVAGFWLLPRTSEHGALAILALPLLLTGAIGLIWPLTVGAGQRLAARHLAWTPVAAAVALVLVASTRSHESLFPVRDVRRDHTATVIATGAGGDRGMLINGTIATTLTPITKFMAHLPLAFLEHRPTDALVVCFGMGTTFRSLLSWEIRATAVELVPSVPALFSYFHADALELVRSPNARIVIDDGRRFLERSVHRYDVITIDPPNPPEAAGSSLLYSREFYGVARSRLREGGILQQWIPTTDLATIASVTRAVVESFPHVRAFPVVNRRGEAIDVLGVHFLASARAIPSRQPAELVRRLPVRAAHDLLEWPYAATAEGAFAAVLQHEVPAAALIRLAPWAPALQDDRPVNEYFLLRRWLISPPSTS